MSAEIQVDGAGVASALSNGGVVATPPTPAPAPAPADDVAPMSPDAEEFHVQPLTRTSRTVAGSAMELGTALELIKAGGDAPVVGIAPENKSKSSASLNSQSGRRRKKEKSTLSQQSSTSVDSKGNKKKKKKKREKTVLGEDGKPLAKKESSALSKSGKDSPTPAVGTETVPGTGQSTKSKKSKALAKKKAKKVPMVRPKPKMKHVVMVGGMPFYREVGTTNLLTKLHKTEVQNDMLNMAIMDGNCFVPKKDFDTEPATLAELNPPLGVMPWEAPAPELKLINTRDFVMPKGRGGMRDMRDRQTQKRHATDAKWNSETINPDSWKPNDEVQYRNDGRYHEFRPTDRFVRPKDWRILHPDAYDPSSKGIFVLKALEDLRTTGGTQETAQLTLTNNPNSKRGKRGKSGKMLKITQKMPPRAGKEPKSASGDAGNAGSTKDDAPLVGESAFLTQDGLDESGGGGGAAASVATVGGDADAVAVAAAAAAASQGEIPENIVATSNPDFLNTTPLEQALVAVTETWTVHKQVGDREFAHGTWGKWDKFNSDSSHRKRLQVPTPQILKRKPKFNAFKYVTKHQHNAVNTAVGRAKLTAAGIFEIERPLKDRQVRAEPDRHRASKIKEKPRWATRSVLTMLKDILSTENSKLKALESQLHRASEDIARSGAQVYTLDSYRQSIQKIRRRIADLREAVAYVLKDTWIKDITRLLISSAVPLDKFLSDAEGLKADGKFLVDDMPWNNM